MAEPTKNILIVDDEKNFATALTAALSSPEVNVTTAADGDEALQLLNNTGHDIIITDLNMPRMGGMELIAEVRQRWTDIKVIICTAYPSEGSKQQAQQLDVSGYLTKPIKLEEVGTLVRNLLHSHAAQPEAQ